MENIHKEIIHCIEDINNKIQELNSVIKNVYNYKTINMFSLIKQVENWKNYNKNDKYLIFLTTQYEKDVMFYNEIIKNMETIEKY